MEEFAVTCECGASLSALATQAGSTVACRCGRQVKVPRLSELRERFSAVTRLEDPANRSLDTKIIASVAAAYLIIGYFLFGPAILAVLTAMLMILGSKVWFLALMFSEMGGVAILVFIVPFLDWLFLFKRYDITWKPILLQFVGWVALVVAIGVTKP